MGRPSHSKSPRVPFSVCELIGFPTVRGFPVETALNRTLSLRKSGEQDFFPFVWPQKRPAEEPPACWTLQLNPKVFSLKNTFPHCYPMRKQMKIPAEKTKGGRPPKFAESSRPITLTLPESTLRDLQHIDPDRGHAIVKLTRRALHSAGVPKPLVEISKISADTGLSRHWPQSSAAADPVLASCRSRACTLSPCPGLRSRFQEPGNCHQRRSGRFAAERKTGTRIDRAITSTHERAAQVRAREHGCHPFCQFSGMIAIQPSKFRRLRSGPSFYLVCASTGGGT